MNDQIKLHILSPPLIYLAYDDYLVLTFLFIAATYYLHQRIWNKSDPNFHQWFEIPQKSGYQSVRSPGQTRNLDEKLANTNIDFIIFWGSQSGTAEGFAYRVAKDLRRRFGAESLVADLSDYDVSTIPLVPKSKIFIFIMSTYGEGEPSDNAIAFFDFLKNAPSNSMAGLRYGAFGLGNSDYRFYNRVIDDVTGLLNGLGAIPVFPVGKGNEADCSTEEDFMEFKEKLGASLGSHLNLQENETSYTPTIEITYGATLSLDEGILAVPSQENKSSNITSKVALFPVLRRRDLVSTSIEDRKCVHLELDLSANPKIKYKTGDHIAIWPKNPEEEVSRILRALELESKRYTVINCRWYEKDDNQLKIPTPTTLEALFRYHLEICAPVARETVVSLAQFASSDKAKSLLYHLGKDRIAYANFLRSNHLTFGRLLQYVMANDTSISWAGIPLSFVLESLPRLRPRRYSISSSNVCSPRQVSITVAVKDIPLPDNPRTKIPGLTSTYLSQLGCTSERQINQETDNVPMYLLYAQVQHSSFKLPASPAVPLIMVAAGTRIAPFRGFLQERARLAATGRTVGSMLLFFGCQHPDRDFLYKDELTEFMAGPLDSKLQLFTAFSRTGSEKQYVQHRLQEECERVLSLLLEEDASFYVCGSVKMSKAVEKCVIGNIRRRKAWSDAEVELWRLSRRRAKRWQEDVWS